MTLELMNQLWALLTFMFVGALLFSLGVLVGAWLRRAPGSR